MALVQMGAVYAVAEFHGRAVRGQRKGGMLSPKGGNWKRVHELNLPVLCMARVGRLLSWPGLAVERAYELAGLFWRLASEAANSDLPGYFVERRDGRLGALNDPQMARLVGLSLQAWQAAAEQLLAGSGIGALELTTVQLEVGQQDEAPYRDGQLGLPLRFIGAEVQKVPGAVFSRSPPGTFPTGADYGTERNGTERNATRRNATRRDATEPRASGTPPESAAPAPEPPRPADSAPGDPPRPASFRPVDSGHVDLLYGKLLAYVRSGDQERALMVWIQGLEELLCRGPSSAQDRRDFGRVFGRAWNRAGQDGPATVRERERRLDVIWTEAAAIAVQEGIDKPIAVWNRWAKVRGWRDGPQQDVQRA